MMKSIKNICLMLVLFLVISSCSKKKTITIDEANDIAKEAFDLNCIEEANIDMLSDITLIDKDLIKHYRYMRPITNLETQQYIIIEPVNGKMEDVKKALKTHLDNSIEIYESYLPEEAKKLKDAELFTTDNLVILLVGGDVKSAKEKILR